MRPEKGGKLEEAVRYSLNQKEQLTAFLEAPEVPIRNHLAEYAIPRSPEVPDALDPLMKSKGNI